MFVLTQTTMIVVVAAGIACLLIMIAVIYGSLRRCIRKFDGESTTLAELIAKRQLLQEEHNELTRRIEDNRKELLTQDGERKAQEELRKELARLEEQRILKEQDLRDLERRAQEAQEVHARLPVLQEKTESLREEIEDLKKQKDALDKEVNELERTAIEYRANKAELDRLDERVQDLRARVADLEDKRTQRDTAAKELAVVEQKLGGVRAEYQDLSQKVALHRAEETAFAARVEVLKQEYESYSQGKDATKDPAYADLFNNDTCPIKKEHLKEAAPKKNERDMLSRFQTELIGEGLEFPERMLYAFHTSLKCQDINPITVLAGVSGTGKTLLPVKYADFFGMHTLVIPVQPRWDSPQDLFGFYNYLERRFKPTELSRALVRMDPFNYRDMGWDWAHDRMLLVLLDEMNLARTEYYFSEFLSKLELRRQIRHPENAMLRHKAEIELEGGNAGRKLSLWVPNNVLFVGTMNEDESTQTLSDKVLDRANVLRFGKPRTLGKAEADAGAPSASKENTQHLQKSTWQDWVSPIYMDLPDFDKCRDWVDQLNEAMEKVGRPFGYRVRDAIFTYLSNYPDPNRVREAMADQIEQKILPKLRGVDMTSANHNVMDCIDEVEAVIEKTEDADLLKAYQASRVESQEYGTFVWRGVSRG